MSRPEPARPVRKRVEGLSALTMRRVAGACGVQSPTLYWHFRDKADLFAAMCRRATSPMDTLVAASRSS